MRALISVTAAVGAFLAAAVPARAHGDDSDLMCYSVDDCIEAPPCHTVECASVGVAGNVNQQEYHSGECTYTRLPVDECCLTSEECCAFAAPHQIGVCDKNCTCQFASSLQCVEDEDCDGLLSSTLCSNEGECFYPHCEVGLCQCFNGTGADVDKDGLACPEDCDDLDSEISETIVCSRDRDDDHFADCYCGQRTYEHTYHHHRSGKGGGKYDSDDDDDECCRRFCVEPNHTCPRGWTNPLDANRFQKPRSQRADTGSPCTEDEANAVQPEEDDCDCCDRDKRAFPNSMFASSRPNNCHEADYNCDGEPQRVVCCSDGQEDQYSDHGRTLWYTSECIELDDDDCGGCSTSGGEPVLEQGWACSESCEQYDLVRKRGEPALDSENAAASGSEDATSETQRRKRSIDWQARRDAEYDLGVEYELGGKHGGGKSGGGKEDPTDCPESCNGECVCVDETTKPMLGECAKLVIDCVEVRPELYSDVEQCCAVAVV